MPAVGGCLRTAYRCTAVDAHAAWPGFPAHASRLADKVSQRVFSDKVRPHATPLLASPFSTLLSLASWEGV